MDDLSSNPSVAANTVHAQDDDEAAGAASSNSIAPSGFIPSANLDELNEGGEAVVFDDRLGIFEYFTRKEIMKMTFDTATRFYQGVALTEKAPNIEKAHTIFQAVFEQTVMAVSICLSDDLMKEAFSRSATRFKHTEDPWVNALNREMNRIMAQGEG